MKFRKLAALSLSVAMFIAAAMADKSVDSVYAISSDTTMQAELYRFLQETRTNANAQAKQYVLDNAECINGLTVNDPELEKALKDYCSNLFNVAKEHESAEISKRDELLNKLKEEPHDGIRFVTGDEDKQEQQNLAMAIDILSKSIMSLSNIASDSSNKSGNDDNSIETDTSAMDAPDALNITDTDSPNLTEDDLSEVILCSTTPDNVPDGDGNCDSTVRSYMAYTAVTSKRSAQYALLYGANAYTDPTTGIRMVDGRYCIALGSGYTHKVGTKVDLVFEDGSITKCILGDCKSDKDTDASHRYCIHDGSVAEFVIDKNVFNTNTKRNAVNTAIDQFGKIKKVVIIR